MESHPSRTRRRAVPSDHDSVLAAGHLIAVATAGPHRPPPAPTAVSRVV